MAAKGGRWSLRARGDELPIGGRHGDAPDHEAGPDPSVRDGHLHCCCESSAVLGYLVKRRHQRSWTRKGVRSVPKKEEERKDTKKKDKDKK